MATGKRIGPSLGMRAGSFLLTVPVAVAACMSSRERVVLEPGVQIEDAVVDVESGTVTMQREGVVVRVQAAMLPAPRASSLHPSFWVTVENTREESVHLRPAEARLIDTFGNQLAPVPMSVSEGDRRVRYALVDPEIHTYVSLHFGWPYYPIYPYTGWFAHPRFSRLRYWHYDPFWTLGIGPVWIHEIGPPPTRRPAEADPTRQETVYSDARVTYVVVFPELDRTARDLRLIVPGVRIQPEGEPERALDFELTFRQILTVGERP